MTANGHGVDSGAAILLVNALATIALTGLIWFVQLVHYPLFALADNGRFARYEAEHARRTSWVVAPLMTLEAVTAMMLVN